MRNYTLRPYATTFILLVLFFSLPTPTTEMLKGRVISFFTPIWEELSFFRTVFVLPEKEAFQRLEAENQFLSRELAALQQEGKKPPMAKVAKVIYRSPFSWNSCLWIGLGEGEVQKDSPVVLGRSLVGIVDYVGKKQSLVRLVTDEALVPSVRVARGEPEHRRIVELIGALVQELLQQKNSKVVGDLFPLLEHVREQFLLQADSFYLAKGELHGTSAPLWRGSGRVTLKGIGFNYDFSDEQGASRDLRTGILDTSEKGPGPILLLGDLLVTTGLDGLFPEGLEVAKVSSISSLKEGDYFYEIEAEPTCLDLRSLEFVFVLPPVGYVKEVAPRLAF